MYDRYGKDRNLRVFRFFLFKIIDILVFRRCGAAALSPKIQQAVYERLNRPVIRQGYGLTETTLSVLKTSDDSGKIGSVGTLAAETLGRHF